MAANYDCRALVLVCKFDDRPSRISAEDFHLDFFNSGITRTLGRREQYLGCHFMEDFFNLLPNGFGELLFFPYDVNEAQFRPF